MPTLEDLLVSCLEAPPRERASRLAAACTSFPELADQLRRMFAQLEGLGFLADDAARRPQPHWRPPEQLGSYRLDDEIGRGGMGIVYRARQVTLGDRVVALKLIRPDLVDSSRARARFLREALLASRLDHPNVCGVLEVGQTDELPWLAMPFVEGQSLHDRLAQARARRQGEDRCLPRLRPDADGSLDDLLRGFVALARGLEHAHGHGLVHRDVKPGNVLVASDGRLVLLDFGLARGLEAEATLTASQDLLGTPAYMAPEQAERGPVDARVDVYGLGATLYECLTLEVPHPAATRDAMLARILRDPAPDPRRVARWLPSQVASIIAGALEPDRERRYHSAAALADDLQRAVDRRPVAVRRPTAWQRTRFWMKRNPWPTAVGALLVAATVVSASLVRVATANARDAREMARRFEAGDLVARAFEAAEFDDLLALDHAIAAFEKDADNPRARDHLHEAMRSTRRIARLAVGQHPALAVQFVQQGERIVAAFEQTSAIVDRTGRVLDRCRHPQATRAVVTEDAEGPAVLLAGHDGVIRRWAKGSLVELPGVRASPGAGGYTFQSAAVDAARGRAYFGGRDGVLYRVDLQQRIVEEEWRAGRSDEPPVIFACHVLAPGSVAWAWNVGGRSFVAASLDGKLAGPFAVPLLSAMSRGHRPTEVAIAYSEHVALLDMKTGEKRTFPTPGTSEVTALAMGSDSLYAGGFGGEVVRLDLFAGQQPSWFALPSLHTGMINQVVVDGPETIVTLGGEDEKIRLTNYLGHGGPPFRGLGDMPTRAGVDPKRKLLAAGSLGGWLCLWHQRDPTPALRHDYGPFFGQLLLSGEETGWIAGPGGRVNAADFESGTYRVAVDRQRGISGYSYLTQRGDCLVRVADQCVSVHDASGTELGRTPLGGKLLPCGAGWLDDETLGVALNGGSQDKPRLQTFRWVNGVLEPGSEHLVADTWDRPATFWQRVTFSLDGSMFAAACKDGTVRAYLTSDASPIGTPLPHSIGPQARSLAQVAIDRPGTRLASTSTDGTVKVWARDAAGSFALERLLTEFPTKAWAIAFDATGTRIACADEGGLVRVLDLHGRLLEEYRVDAGPRSLAFTPSGRRLYATLENGRAVSWFLDRDELLRRARALRPR